MFAYREIGFKKVGELRAVQQMQNFYCAKKISRKIFAEL
jgi:hypothetical protein